MGTLSEPVAPTWVADCTLLLPLGPPIGRYWALWDLLRSILCPLMQPSKTLVFLDVLALGFPIRHLMALHWIPLGTLLDPIEHPCASHWDPLGPPLGSIVVPLCIYWTLFRVITEVDGNVASRFLTHTGRVSALNR